MGTSIKRRIKDAVPDTALAYGYFIQEETKSSYRFSDPSLLRRGYHSIRRWMYPAGFETQREYVSDLEFAKRISGLNPSSLRKDVGDKGLFAQILIDNGFANYLPRQYGILTGADYSQTTEYDDRPVFVKPIDGRAGGGLRTYETLAACLDAAVYEGAFLVQERIISHPYSAAIFPGSINVLRLQTGRKAEGSQVELLGITHRFGSHKNAPGDAYTTGGFLSRVDMKTGRLSHLIGMPNGRKRTVLECHPDTGGTVSDVSVPYLEMAKELVISAADIWTSHQFLGWDVAITERGPVIVEANAAWPNIAQLQAHGPVGLRSFFE